MNLASLQKKFKDKVLGSKILLDDFPIIENGLEKEHRFFLYQNNTISSLTDILQICYPKTLQLLGSNDFIKMCHQLIFKYPPTNPCLSEFSPNMKRVLQANKQDPKVIQVADLEWHLIKAKFSEPVNLFDPSTLMQWSENDLNQGVFQINPAVNIFSANYSFHLVWEDITNLSKLYEEKNRYIITSKKGIPYFILMDNQLEYFIQSSLQGHNLKKIIKDAEGKKGEFDLLNILGQTINNNLVIGCKI